MINKVYKFISENKILENGDSVVLGVSGGADSICMLYILCQLREKLKLKLHVVHVNHNIRGEQANNDQEYVREICKKLGVSFSLESVDVPKLSKQYKVSEEEAGRMARYSAFHKEAERVNSNKIAVAHNLNDNSETILFNLFRGAGIKGLTGIPVKRDMIVRPLMCCTRKEIEEYLSEIGVTYCNDYTNNEIDYSRNKLRLEVFPYIKENINSKVEYNIVNAAENLEEIYDYLKQQAQDAYKTFVKDGILGENGFKLHPAVLNEVIRMLIEEQAGKLKDITRTHITSVAELRYMSVSKSISLPYDLIAVRTYDGICIKKSEPEKIKNNQEKQIMIDGQIFESENIDISFETKGVNLENIPDLVYTKWLDYDKIHRLSLRNRKPGDYIIIDDKGSKKKLKDYFIDKKIPQEERDDILLIADGNHIVWIIGHRISSYYKVIESTSTIIKITYKKD